MNIKVCGVTEMKQLQQLDGLDIDFAGLVFQKDSPRYVVGKLNPKEVKRADFDLKKVGVFFNPELIEVLEAIDEYGIEVVQLNGEESPEMCEDLGAEVEVIKAFSIKNDQKNIDKTLSKYDAVCDYYLFDKMPDYSIAGTGEQFDWTILAGAKIEKPFFLSGGIGVEDAVKIRTFKHPDFFGVDINSKVESAPGIKDMSKVLQFKMALK